MDSLDGLWVQISIVQHCPKDSASVFLSSQLTSTCLGFTMWQIGIMTVFTYFTNHWWFLEDRIIPY